MPQRSHGPAEPERTGSASRGGSATLARSLQRRQRRSPHRCPRWRSNRQLSKSAGVQRAAGPLREAHRSLGLGGPHLFMGRFGSEGAQGQVCTRRSPLARVSMRYGGRAAPSTPGTTTLLTSQAARCWWRFTCQRVRSNGSPERITVRRSGTSLRAMEQTAFVRVLPRVSSAS